MVYLQLYLSKTGFKRTPSLLVALSQELHLLFAKVTAE